MINPYKGGHDRLPAPGLQPSEKKKLWIFAILFVLVLGIFLASLVAGNLSGEDPTAGETDTNVLPQVAPRRDEAGNPLVQYKPRGENERRNLKEDELLNRLSTFVAEGKLRDDDAADHPDVLDYLREAALYDTSVTSVSELDHRVLPEEDAAYDPGPFRGRFTSAFGEVVAVPDPISYTVGEKAATELYPVIFRSADGYLYRVLGTTPIPWKVGDWVQAYGLFYRKKTVEVDGEEKPAFSLVATKKVTEAFPPVTVEEIDPEWAKLVRENDSELAGKVDERPFWLIMNYVKNLGIEGFRAKKAAGEVDFQEMADNAQPLAGTPELYRFEFVAMNGKPVRSYKDYLQKDNPGKIDVFWSATLVQPSRYLVRLASPRPWSDYGITVGDEFCRVEGIFYKRWQYRPEGKVEPHEIPLVIVTDIIPDEREDREWMKTLQWFFLGAAGLIVLAFFFFALRNAKARREFRERVLEQKRQREARKSGDPRPGGDSGEKE